MGSEKERDETKEEALVARLATVAAGNAKAKAEGDLARVKDVQAAAEEAKTVLEEARHKADAEATCLEVDRTSLMLELGTAKDEVSSLQSQVSKDKEVPNGMPEFFVSPGAPWSKRRLRKQQSRGT